MDDQIERDSIINVSGLPTEILPSGENAKWTLPDPVYLPAIRTLCEPELHNLSTALGTFSKVVTVMKNSFYMAIVERVKEREDYVPNDHALRELAEDLEKQGFGKTLLVGNYKNTEFMGLVMEWCNKHGYFVLFPFSMDTSLDLFIDKQLALHIHDKIC